MNSLLGIRLRQGFEAELAARECYDPGGCSGGVYLAQQPGRNP